MNRTMNLNDIVIVKLKPKGITALERDAQKCGVDVWKYSRFEKDGEQYLKTELWNVMNLFGSLMFMGQNNLPIETTFEVVDTMS